ncbi:MAG: ADP-forming succinate--CoA ligase subunit beta [Bacillota bacterium]
MKLIEKDGKDIFKRFGIPVPQGRLAHDPDQAAAAAAELGGRAVVKAQVLRGKRGKAGAVRLVGSPEEARQAAAAILGMDLGGERVTVLLVEERLDIAKELYAGITIDPGRGSAVLIFSARGGMDIEEVAATAPEAVVSLTFDGVEPVRRHDLYALVKRAGLTGPELVAVTNVLLGLVQGFTATDATTAEINPLVIVAGGRAVAADAKLVIDDSALFRHKDLTPTETEPQGPLEKAAREAGVAYVPLAGGEVGVIAGGAGLALATMDTISTLGSRPADFLDVGGGVSVDRMAASMRIVAGTPGVRGILVNVFGGINNCELMARGVLKALDEDHIEVPVVVKMRGHSQDEGWALLEAAGIDVIKKGTTEEAVRLIIQKISERNEDHGGLR